MNKMKKLFVLFIILFSLVFVSDAFFTAEATSGNVDVKITALFDTGNEVDFPAITRAYGATVTHAEAVGSIDGTGYEFVFWVVNGVVDHTLDESATFTVTSRLNLQAVYKPVGDFVVVFVDANGVYLGSKYTEGGLVNDTGIQLPGKPNYTPNGWVSIEGSMSLSSISADSVFMLQYVADGTLPTVNVSVTNGTAVGEVDFNTVVTVNPNPADSGLEFSHWTENGKVVSYQAEYKFTALVDRSLTAVYVATGTVVEEAVVTLSNDLELRDGYHTYTGQVYLPSGYELVEYGFLFSNSAVILEYGNAPVKAQSSNMNENTSEFITSFSIGSHMAMRAYAIYFNGVSNEIILSDLNHRYLEETSHSFNFSTGHTTSYIIPETSVNFTNTVDSSAFPVSLYRVAANTVAISGQTTSRSLVISPRLGGSDIGVAYAIFDFQAEVISKISFDTYFWNSSAEQYFTKYELQYWNQSTEEWVMHTDLLGYIEGTLIVNNIELYNFANSRLRFYAEGGESGGNTARLNLDNLTIYKLYKGEVHDVVFNNDSNLTNQLIADGGTVASFTPSKTGYTFNGWYTTDTFDEPAYNFSTPVTTDLTLYAKYTINQYTITFDSNDGTAVTPITQNYGTSVSEPSDPTRVGYAFNGWYSDDNTFLLEYEFTTMTENITLFAKWTINQYTITFDSNEGSAVTPITQNYGTSVVEPTNPTRDGFTFEGWFLDDETFENEYTFSSMPASNITLYAKWTEVAENESTITFVSNGGSAVAPLVAEEGSAISEPAEPTREGYTFVAWYTDNGTFENLYSFTTMPVDDLTLYADWTINEYTITFDSNGGSAVAPITQNYGTNVIEPSNPTASNYTFIGWFTDVELLNQYTFTTMPGQNITLYAKWETVIYTTGFETSDSFTAGTVYNNTTIKYDGPISQQWGTYYGTASTTGPITGSMSMQMRFYTAAPSNLGYTFTNFSISNVTKVTFKALNTSGNNVRVSYSTDGGATYIGDQTFTLGTSAASYTYNVNYEGSIRIRFMMVPGTTNGSRITLDDIVIYGYQNP